jgi:alkylation response protein AidB-like acyl-CoA dehydrogenase
MNSGFSQEQDLPRSEVADFRAKRCRGSEVRRLGAETDSFSFSAALWPEVSELGWRGLMIAESHGGAGLAWLDLVVPREEAGRQLFPPGGLNPRAPGAGTSRG